LINYSCIGIQRLTRGNLSTSTRG